MKLDHKNVIQRETNPSIKFVHTVQIKQPTRCTFSCKIFYCLNAAQYVSGNILPIIRSTFELQQPPVPV
jgi:hypothetical protein